MYLKQIDQIRTIQWGASYLWDIKFPDAPSPFNEWFPAVDVEKGMAVLNSYEFQAGQSTFKIPQSTTTYEISITFLDDYQGTLLDWISDWINKDILNEGKGVKPLTEIVKLVQIAKLDSMKNLIKTYSYLVYPEGTITFHGSSTPDVKQYTVTFVVAGEVEH